MEHLEEEIAGQGSGEVFERVAADEMADGEDLSVEGFEEFREDVEHSYPDKIRSARVARKKEEKKKRG